MHTLLSFWDGIRNSTATGEGIDRPVLCGGGGLVFLPELEGLQMVAHPQVDVYRL